MTIDEGVELEKREMVKDEAFLLLRPTKFRLNVGRYRDSNCCMCISFHFMRDL
jgi:hypothetical protein